MKIKDGYGKGKVYYLNNDYSAEINDRNEISYNEDEIKIIDYIENHGDISNQTSREKLGFNKHKNVNLFNSLMKKGKIIKVGTGSSIKYILNRDL